MTRGSKTSTWIHFESRSTNPLGMDLLFAFSLHLFWSENKGRLDGLKLAQAEMVSCPCFHAPLNASFNLRAQLHPGRLAWNLATTG